MHAIQDQRKVLQCAYTDRIEVCIVTDDPELQTALQPFAGYIQSETLCIQIGFSPIAGVEPTELKLGGRQVELYVKVTS